MIARLTFFFGFYFFWSCGYSQVGEISLYSFKGNRKYEIIKVTEIINLLKESKTTIKIDEKKNGNQPTVFKIPLKSAKIICLEYSKTNRIKLYLSPGDRIVIRELDSNSFALSGTVQAVKLNNLLISSNLFKAEQYLKTNDVSSTLFIEKIEDSLNALFNKRNDFISEKNKDKLFYNYFYGELIGQQYLKLNYLEHKFLIDSSLSARINLIWDKFPILYEGSLFSRAYVNAAYFFTRRKIDLSGSFANEFDRNFFGLGFCKKEFNGNKDLEDLFRVSFVDGMIYVSSNLSDLNRAIDIYNSEKESLSQINQNAINNTIFIKQSQFGVNSIKNFGLPDFKGKNYSILDFNTEYILIDFWATWCVPCVESMNKMMNSKFDKSKTTIVFVNINDEFNKWIKFGLEIRSIGTSLFADKEMSKALSKDFFINTIPYRVLVDKNLNVISLNESIIEEITGIKL